VTPNAANEIPILLKRFICRTLLLLS
jgi:hypothetical protein